MIFNFTKKYIAELTCLGLAVFVLSGMLLPGYVLTLDMAWTPDLPYSWNADAPNNLFMLLALFHTLALVVPAWVVQKIFLLVLIFLLFFIPWKFLPVVQGTTARLVAVGIFALNPFVYGRILAGQWFVLLGYALLPLVLWSLMRLANHPGRRTAILFALVLTLVGFVSIHFLYLASVVSVVWLTFVLLWRWFEGKAVEVRLMARSVFLAGVGFVVVNLFWIVPAMMRSAPLEARFNETYFSTFSAVGNGAVPVMANVAVLGGFWGEGLAWRYYFVWPQDQPIFLVVAGVVVFLVFLGLGHLCRKRETRLYGLLFVSMGGFAYITALGLADTPFKAFNLFLYEHVPLWGGLRDSHKIAGVLALVYAIGSGVGVGILLAYAKRVSFRVESFLSIAIFFLPVVMGIYMWNGFYGQLKPVSYPRAWYEAKVAIDKMPAGEKVLVLPWHGYLSLDFAGNRVVANPTESFFGRNRIISGRGVEFGNIYDQEVDPAYRDMDTFVRSAETLSPEALATGLRTRGIGAVLVIANPAIPHSEEGLTRWTQFSAETGDTTRDDDTDSEPKTWAQMLSPEITTFIMDKSLILLEIKP